MRLRRRNGPRAEVAVAIGLEHGVARDREAGRDSCAEPVLGHVRDASGDRVARIAGPQLDAGDGDLARRQPAHARQRLGQLALPVARHPSDAHDLAAAHLQRDAVQRGQPAVTLCVQVVGLEHDIGERIRALPPPARLDLAADHQRGEALGRRARSRHRRDDAPAAQHGDAVGDLQHLVQLVRDEDDGAAVGRHRAQRLEERARLLRRQHGGRLVEDQDARVAVERLEDLDALLLADRELPDAGARVDGEAELIRQRGHLALERRRGRARADGRAGRPGRCSPRR